MSAIIWSSEAEVDLQDIYEFISQESEYYAVKQLNELILRPEILLVHPELGRTVPERSVDFIREIFEGKYRIIYRTDRLPDIEIMRVFHFARYLNNL